MLTLNKNIWIFTKNDRLRLSFQSYIINFNKILSNEIVMKKCNMSTIDILTRHGGDSDHKAAGGMMKMMPSANFKTGGAAKKAAGGGIGGHENERRDKMDSGKKIFRKDGGPIPLPHKGDKVATMMKVRKDTGKL